MCWKYSRCWINSCGMSGMNNDYNNKYFLDFDYMLGIWFIMILIFRFYKKCEIDIKILVYG